MPPTWLHTRPSLGTRIDSDRLRATPGAAVDSGPGRFSFTWAGKDDAVSLLRTPSRATLTPTLWLAETGAILGVPRRMAGMTTAPRVGVPSGLSCWEASGGDDGPGVDPSGQAAVTFARRRRRP